MPAYRNIAGTWRPGVYWRNIAGTWKAGVMWRNIAGVWKLVSGMIISADKTQNNAVSVDPTIANATVTFTSVPGAVFTYTVISGTEPGGAVTWNPTAGTGTATYRITNAAASSTAQNWTIRVTATLNGQSASVDCGQRIQLTQP